MSAMQISRASDYGVRAMVHLAGLPGDIRASLADLAASTEVPSAFLSKVLQRLVKAGYVRSRRGHGGGFTIACDSATISMFDLVVVFDGPLALNACLLPGGCERSPRCVAHRVWIDAQARVREVLNTTTLAMLASQAPSPLQK